MKKENINYIVYHYEFTNDGRRILIFEPNVFRSSGDAQKHCNILHYLSGQSFYWLPEKEISHLDLILDNIEVVNSDVLSIYG